MNYVYKYVNGAGATIYIGITNNLKRRIAEHEHDKLKDIEYSDIYYFPVRHREDAELIEEYLINHYETDRFHNVAKTHKGPVSFLGNGDSFPWVKFLGKVDETLEPFMAFNEREVVVKQTRYVEKLDTNQKINQIYDELTEALRLFNEEQSYETEIIKQLQHFLDSGIGDLDIVKTGLRLHQEAFRLLEDFRKVYFSMLSTKEEKEHAGFLYKKAKGRVEKFESILASKCG